MGYAAIQLAKAIGSKVIATTHKESKLPLLKGADEAVLDTGKLQGQLFGVTKALELVGAEYDFSEIKEACVALDSGKVNGKIVVKVT